MRFKTATTFTFKYIYIDYKVQMNLFKARDPDVCESENAGISKLFKL